MYDDSTDEIICRPQGPGYITTSGTVLFCDSPDVEGISRVHGPARIEPDGYLIYANGPNGVHRTTGPAIIDAGGNARYIVRGTEMDPFTFFLKFNKT